MLGLPVVVVKRENALRFSLLRETEKVANVIAVVCHVFIVTIGHGSLKEFWPMVAGCVQRTAGSSFI